MLPSNDAPARNDGADTRRTGLARLSGRDFKQDVQARRVQAKPPAPAKRLGGRASDEKRVDIATC